MRESSLAPDRSTLLAHTHLPSGTTVPPAPPELPEGWHYTDDLVWEEPQGRVRQRRIALVVLAVVVAAAAIVALAVLNAQAHYSRGVAALHARDYALAAAQLSGATLYVLPYRDASLLADEARREASVSYARQEAAAARVSAARAALREASAALKTMSASAVLTALQAVDSQALQAAARDDQGVATAAGALTHEVGAAAGQALNKFEWGRAETLAAALALLDPKSAAASELAARATQGRTLSARLAEAQDAARHHEWRKALRLALAVSAAHKDFPGAAAVVAQARKALKPKPAASSAATTTTPATSSGGTTSGASSGSSGSSSQPPPP
jgi:hypothetical protein